VPGDAQEKNQRERGLVCEGVDQSSERVTQGSQSGREGPRYWRPCTCSTVEEDMARLTANREAASKGRAASSSSFKATTSVYPACPPPWCMHHLNIRTYVCKDLIYNYVEKN
jgi:hypothetical protein